jgi:protein ImuA
MSTSVTRSGTEELRERIRRLEGAAGRRRLVLPFGLTAIDRHLPGGGLALGALHEVAGGGHGAIDGAAAALFAAGIAARLRGRVLWCLTRHDLFAPALAQAGLLPGRVGRARRNWSTCFSPRLPPTGLKPWPRPVIF